MSEPHLQRPHGLSTRVLEDGSAPAAVPVTNDVMTDPAGRERLVREPLAAVGRR